MNEEKLQAMSEENLAGTRNQANQANEPLSDTAQTADALQKKKTRRPASKTPTDKPPENRVVKLLEKNPLGMTLPEMAGGTRQLKKIRTLRPILAEAIRLGMVMPVSQRAGHTVYRLVKHLGPR